MQDDHFEMLAMRVVPEVVARKAWWRGFVVGWVCGKAALIVGLLIGGVL